MSEFEKKKMWLGALLGLVVFGVVYLLTTWEAKTEEVEEEEEEQEPPRDYTLDQLRGFDDDKIYVAIKGDIFDVTSKRDMYGPEGSYGIFAGRDASRCLGKMSLEAEDLDGPIDDLTASEVDALDQWYTTFKDIKCYPVVGKLSRPPPKETPLTVNDLAPTEIPPGRLSAPLLIAVRGTVYDVSFGGTDHYGPGGPYHAFCGKDASRALAKMSLDPNDLDNAHGIADLSEKEIKILDDWEALFKRKYPAVGTLVS